MPALVAVRFNPDLKAKYTQFIDAGKPPKLALTAIMRKLLVMATPYYGIIGCGPKSGLDQDGYSADCFAMVCRCDLALKAKNLLHMISMRQLIT